MATIAIEGNTLTEEEVSQIKKENFPKRASRAYEEQEAKNIIALNITISPGKYSAETRLKIRQRRSRWRSSVNTTAWYWPT